VTYLLLLVTMPRLLRQLKRLRQYFLGYRKKVKANSASNDDDATPRSTLKGNRGKFLNEISSEDMGSDPKFSTITSIVETIFGVKCAVVYIFRTEQSLKGSAHDDITEVSSNSLDGKAAFFANLAKDSSTIIEVLDCRKDSRFCSSSQHNSLSGVRFYAGAPIFVGDTKVGVLSLIDTQPRTDGLTHSDRILLGDFAALVSEAVIRHYHLNPISSERSDIMVCLVLSRPFSSPVPISIKILKCFDITSNISQPTTDQYDAQPAHPVDEPERRSFDANGRDRY
jgi:GAF domain